MSFSLACLASVFPRAQAVGSGSGSMGWIYLHCPGGMLPFGHPFARSACINVKM